MDKFKTPYDVVIVLGKNWQKYPPAGAKPDSFDLQLRVESKLSALAAGEMYQEGLAGKILFSTGKTAGSDFPSEAVAMKEFMKKKFPRIPEKDIILEEKSFDTVSNAVEVKKLVRHYGFKKLALLTVQSHMPRADALFKEFGLKVDDYYSEEAVKKISQHYRNFVRNYQDSPQAKIEKIKELLLKQFLILDPKGKYLQGLTRRIRHQVATTTLAENGTDLINPIFLALLE